ncbi:MAG: hypothetical protein HN344_01930 [Gammaproteobacteria bacterium]|jgi:hypothetical protein|nr:hypothetical protein [Gammaproteobacteria bacterium]
MKMTAELKGLLLAAAIGLLLVVVLLGLRSATTPSADADPEADAGQQTTAKDAPPAGKLPKRVAQPPSLLKTIVEGNEDPTMLEHLRKIRESSQ